MTMLNQNPQETNINVVVRVRPRNPKEIKENSPVAVTTNGKKGKEVHIKAHAADLNSRTYTFDKVFGPEADQNTVFDDVVVPILDEVRLGYNCTIFAYGQTGTGKTYTMEGDLDTARGEHAGIIPRTLYSLFDTLESETAGEYSVRVSYIELYNEELKDLLSPDEDLRKLKLFEDANKRGSVVVQGMEEVMVNNAADVISILQKGSNKRQIASTKMNETSSRSHGIFSITVHIKEVTTDGEDLLKVGKLNLVDLAGSENIGRSGAKEKRAVEAGMINQSLLTLGRVINALVDRSPHIPYRESKLTRLLQDSLGGRTKTCIIAAVSPAKCNLEESLSTLDYAYRAKNIRNKPEINQRMTKKALMKEYVAEIAQLKRDLAATREKNGIFLSQETFETLSNENQSGKDRQDELTKDVAAKEEQIKSLQEKFQANMELLLNVNEKLDVAMAALEKKNREFEGAVEELRRAEQGLVEQKVLTSAHAHTEKQLNTMAGNLVSTLRNSLSDMNGLYEKLDRKSAIQLENTGIFNHFQNTLLQSMSQLESQISTFGASAHGLMSKLNEDLASVSQKQLDEKASIESEFSSQLQTFNDTSAQLVQKLSEKDAAMAKELEEVVGLGRLLSSTMDEKSSQSQDIHSQMFVGLKGMITQQGTQTGQWNASTKSEISNMVESLKAHVGEQMMMQHKTQKMVEEGLRAEIAALRSQNHELTASLAKQRESATQSRDNLLMNIGQLLSTYASEQDAAVDGIVRISRKRTEARIEAIQNVAGEHRSAIEDAAIVETRFLDGLATTSGRVVDEMNLGAKRIGETLLNVERHCGNMEASVAAYTGFARNTVKESVKQTEERAQRAFNRNAEHSATFVEEINGLHRTTTNILARGKERHCGDLDELCTNMSDWAETTNKHIAALEQFHREAKEQIGQTQNEVSCKRLAEEQPTGQTPRKKPYKFPTSWRITPSHDEILREYRERGPRPQMTEDPNNPFSVPSATYPQSISRAESESSVDTMVASEKENDGSGDSMMKDVDEGVGGGG
ncbi:kinesin motor protein cin8, partial [Rhizophlyctis rosea]